MQYNRTAPKEQRRYFIRDSFDDCGKLDCMFIEVTREKYEEWHREQSAKYRNRKSKVAYLHISLDAANLNGEADALKETLASEFNRQAAIYIAVKKRNVLTCGELSSIKCLVCRQKK